MDFTIFQLGQLPALVSKANTAGYENMSLVVNTLVFNRLLGYIRAEISVVSFCINLNL